MHAELLWRRRQCDLPFDKVEKLLQVNIGMHAALQCTCMEDLVSKENASSPIWQYPSFKAGENGSLSIMIF